jgi:DNA/RNA non-specific endonuclease
MPQYSGLKALLTGRQTIGAQVIQYLISEWLIDYDLVTPDNEIVETTSSGFSYLFDIMSGRLLSAWGISQGRHGSARDKSRMAGHPLSAGSLYHRGHAIPHTLGGPTDINLVPQLGSINIGPFRALEKRAVATPGALYFTYWRYVDATNQTPIGVDQGLIIPGQPPDIRRHGN